MIFWQLNAKLSENAMKDFTEVCVDVRRPHIPTGMEKNRFKRIFKSFFLGGVKSFL